MLVVDLVVENRIHIGTYHWRPKLREIIHARCNPCENEFNQWMHGENRKLQWIPSPNLNNNRVAIINVSDRSCCWDQDTYRNLPLTTKIEGDNRLQVQQKRSVHGQSEKNWKWRNNDLFRERKQNKQSKPVILSNGRTPAQVGRQPSLFFQKQDWDENSIDEKNEGGMDGPWNSRTCTLEWSGCAPPYSK